MTLHVGRLTGTFLQWSSWARFAAVLTVNALTAALLLALRVTPKEFGDAGEYADAALALARNLLGHGSSGVDLVKGPLVSLYYLPVGIVGALSGEQAMLWATRGLNIAVVSACIWLVLERFRESTRSYLAVALLFMAFPSHVYYSLGILAEPPTLAAVGLLLVASQSEGTRRRAWAQIALLGFALVLVGGLRPNLAPLPLLGLACVGLARVLRPNAMSGRRLVLQAGACAVALVALALLYGLTQRPSSHGARHTKQEAARALVAGRYQLRERWWDFRFFDEVVRGDHDPDLVAYRKTLDELRLEEPTALRAAATWWVQDLVGRPMTAVRVMLQKAAFSFLWVPYRVLAMLGGGSGVVWTMIAGAFVLLAALNALIGFAPVVWAARLPRGEFLASWPQWGPWAAVLLFVMVFAMEPRYVFPGRIAVVTAVGALLGGRRGATGIDHPATPDHAASAPDRTTRDRR